MPFYFSAILSIVAAVILFLFLKESLPSKISSQLELLPVPSSAKDHFPSPDKLAKPFYRVPGFLQACGIGTAVSLGMGAFFAFAPRLLSALGYNALGIGLIFIPGIIVFFCGSMLSGMLFRPDWAKNPHFAWTLHRRTFVIHRNLNPKCISRAGFDFLPLWRSVL